MKKLILLTCTTLAASGLMLSALATDQINPLARPVTITIQNNTGTQFVLDKSFTNRLAVGTYSGAIPLIIGKGATTIHAVSGSSVFACGSSGTCVMGGLQYRYDKGQYLLTGFSTAKSDSKFNHCSIGTGYTCSVSTSPTSINITISKK